MKEHFVLNGYTYDTKAEWEEAKKEEESIRYIRAKTDLSNPSVALKMYNGFVEKRIFITPVGMEFMQELRKEILRSGTVKAEDLYGIPVGLPRRKGRRTELAGENGNKDKMMAEYYRSKLKSMRVVAAMLAIAIIAMFVVLFAGPNSALEDAEIKVQDKYAAWEQELTRREEAVRAREQELGIAN